MYFQCEPRRLIHLERQFALSAHGKCTAFDPLLKPSVRLTLALP